MILLRVITGDRTKKYTSLNHPFWDTNGNLQTYKIKMTFKEDFVNAI